ncbi:MAG: hypothetical protein H0W09_07155, partial [Solirubrobacterales bacterium]|nr:hypothetical protein [Solirubrobacterales bacterium]
TDPTKAPEAAITTLNPDAAHPAAWLNPVYSSTGGLNLLGFKEPEIDKQLNAALAQIDPDKATQQFSAVAEAAGRQYYATGIADRRDVFAANSGISGFSHVPVYIWVARLADLEKN